MSRTELLTEIERLRAKLNDLVADRTDYAKMLEASQVLDKRIVEYHRVTGRSRVVRKILCN